MYNQDLKLRFIGCYTKSANTARQCLRIFEFFAPYEELWGADLCTKGHEEIQNVINSIANTRSTSVTPRIVLLKKYVKWCIENNYPGAIDGISEIDYNGIEKMRDITVANPLQFHLFLNKIFDDERENTIDNTARCLWWMAYGGIPEDQLVHITIYDVDFESMSIHHDIYDAQIYAESLPAFKHCIEQTEFVYKNKNYTSDIIRDRVLGDTLVRGIRSEPSYDIFRSELSRRISRANKAGMNVQHLSYYRIYLSGLFHRIKQVEDAGMKISFVQAAEEFILGKEYNLTSNRTTIDYKKKKIAEDYMIDYKRWKCAHFRHDINP